jgi:ABC-type transport system substrate-binding protein
MVGVSAAAVFVPLAIVTGPNAGAAPSNINPNGVLRYGTDLNNEFSNDFDPGTGSNDCSYTELALIYQSMTAPGQTAISGGVAQSWTVSPDASTVTFHLRPNLEFSNGDPVTATAVMQSLDHIKKSPLRTSLSAIDTMTAPDPNTLVVTLNRPTAGDFLWALTYIDGMIEDPSTIGTTASTEPVGSGPYMLKSYQQGSSIDLVKNPHYYDPSAYKLGGVNFVQVGTGPQAVTALTSGAVDMVPLEPENYSEVKNNPNYGVAVTQSYDYMVMQLRENRAPFNNPKVRAALEYAVDRATINRVVFDGLGEPAYQPFPKSSPGYNKAYGNRDSYNPTKAKAMLKAAGFAHGVPFKLMVPSGDASFDRAAAILQNEMNNAGFKVTIDQIPGSDILVDVYINKQGDAVLSENLTNGPDISNSFESEYESTGFVAQEMGTVNAAITPAIKAANASLSPKLQGSEMRPVSNTVMTQGLEVPIEFIPSMIAYNKQRVGGNVVAPIGSCRSNLSGIYIKK